MEKQRAARQAALVKQLECGCPDSTCADGKSCSHPMRRLSSNKTNTNDKQRHTENNNNHVSSTTPNVLIGTRVSILCPSSPAPLSQHILTFWLFPHFLAFIHVFQLYSRWVDRRGRDQLTEITNPNNTTTMQQLAGNNGGFLLSKRKKQYCFPSFYSIFIRMRTRIDHFYFLGNQFRLHKFGN